jgi:hypothetical protein
MCVGVEHGPDHRLFPNNAANVLEEISLTIVIAFRHHRAVEHEGDDVDR